MYLGHKEITVSEDELGEFYGKGKAVFIDELLENEYAILKYDDEPVGFYRKKDNKLKQIEFLQVNNPFSGVIKPRNKEQKCAMDMLMDEDIRVKVLTGPYGSGKDYLMLNVALDLIHKGYYDKLVYVRNNIEVRDTVPLGALPGGEMDKLLPFAMPLADHVGGIEGMGHLMESGKVEIQHLGYIRGRDIKRSIILSSEAENLTTKHVQLLLGRVGEGSSLWLNGDHRQTDKEIFRTESGLRTIVDKLKGHPLFGYIHLMKSERSEVATLADLLD